MTDLSPLWISLKTTFLATAIAFVLGVYAARWMMKCSARWKGIMDVIFTLPMVLPPTVVGYFLLVLFGKRGMIGSVLESMGIQVVFSWAATVITATVVAFPLIYRTSRGALEQMDENIIHAARTLGMKEEVIFWKIILPVAWPGIMAGILLGFARALGEFGATLMLAGAIPKKTMTMPISIYFAVQSNDMYTAKFWVMCVVALSLISMLVMNYLSGGKR